MEIVDSPLWINLLVTERAVWVCIISIIIALFVLVLQHIDFKELFCCEKECECKPPSTTIPPSDDNVTPSPPPDTNVPGEPDTNVPGEPETNVPEAPEVPEEPDYLDELYDFHVFFKDTLNKQFAQKAEKINNPTRAWNSVTVFENLQPWTNTSDFGTMCHTVIGYCVRYNNSLDTLHKNVDLATNLTNSLRLLAQHLPDPPPHYSAPWGPVADWYHFTITMPEVFMTVTIVLADTVHFDECASLTTKWLGLYLPTATTSMGWTRTAGNAMRMGVPYVYSQMLRKKSLPEIYKEPSVQDVMTIISFPYVTSGNGIHVDSIYIDHIDVRAYGYLINSYFTFNYYIYYFGGHVLNEVGLRQSILNVASPEGIVNPAVMSRNGTSYSNVIGNFVDYPMAVHSADYSKVLTKLSDLYYGCVVGTTPRLAYYEADPTNKLHAPLWAMNRRLWNRSKQVINYTAASMLFESGVFNQNANGQLAVESTTTSTQSFQPEIGETGIVRTENCGAMYSISKFAELNELEFFSCTLYYEQGMYQLYYNLGVRQGSLTANGRLVVLSRDTTIVTEDASFADQRAANNDSSEGTVYNGVVCYRVPITNFTVPSLTTRVQGNVEIVEQVLGMYALYNKTATASYKLNVEGYTDNLSTTYNGNSIYVTVGNVKAVYIYPYVALKEGTRLAVMSVLEETKLPVEQVNIIKTRIQETASTTPVNSSLVDNVFVLNDSAASLQFWFDY